MGSGTERLAVARRLVLDGLQLGRLYPRRRMAEEARPRRADPGGVGEPVGARRRAADPARQRRRADQRPGRAEPPGAADRSSRSADGGYWPAGFRAAAAL